MTTNAEWRRMHEEALVLAAKAETERDEYERRMLQSERVCFDMAVAENARLSAHEATIRDLRADLATAASVAAKLRRERDALKAFVVGVVREKLLHGSNPTLCGEARWLNLPEVRELLDGAENDDVSPLREAQAERDDLRARNEELVAALKMPCPGVHSGEPSLRELKWNELKDAALSKNRGTR